MTIRLSTSLPILEGCLNVTCVQCEIGKSISPVDHSAQPTMAHDADTDSGLARPPDGNHPSARHDAPAILLRSATRRRTAGHVVLHAGPSDSVEATVEQLMGAARTRGDRGGAGRRRTGPIRQRAGAGGPGADPGRRCLSGMLAEHSLIELIG